MAEKQKSGSMGDGPAQKPKALGQTAGANHVKGGVKSHGGDCKGGAKPQKSGSKGG